ncbi:glycoside hydrolase family 26 protein [Hymenobacter sp.]|jgi:mannan endo-1,4-beta-mannosidase|uniref:glycoside hydrolase family 26 protein n=1 Tax=Hymenobacter sp. TaxID=1898978 RepID=UPI002ED8A359
MALVTPIKRLVAVLPFRLLLLVVVLLLGSETIRAQEKAPSDPKATAKTKHLYRSLQRMAGTNIMFGHQDDLAYGVGWSYVDGRSDVQSVTGSYPAVYGWELGHLELDSARNLDKVPFAKIREYVKTTYKRGGINTISWHLNNPTNGKTAWDTARTVAAILPGGAYHAQYLLYLDRLAAYLRTMRSGLTAVPIVFRPFHEHTGNWFWWCENTCTPDEYKALWRFTANYLRNTKKLHNLLLSYSSAEVRSLDHYLERYPGDEYVDMMGFDTYCRRDTARYKQELNRQLAILQQAATQHGKVAALTETGYDRIPATNWWTKTLLSTLKPYNISYVLVWRNGGTSRDHFFAPYSGHPSADDFKQFYNDPRVIFQNRLSPLNVYRKKE